MSARFAEQVTPALKTLAQAHRLTLKQVDSGVWEQLATSANLFASVGIASLGLSLECGVIAASRWI
ncbi:hypothetical protein [Micromonospora sp. DT62]|uniref:hypothetical protein n=1 Tax=Micromonospora sp. DT62 TaxID=3416521 RepID=UPI003CF63873